MSDAPRTQAGKMTATCFRSALLKKSRTKPQPSTNDTALRVEAGAHLRGVHWIGPNLDQHANAGNYIHLQVHGASPGILPLPINEETLVFRAARSAAAARLEIA